MNSTLTALTLLRWTRSNTRNPSVSTPEWTWSPWQIECRERDSGTDLRRFALASPSDRIDDPSIVELSQKRSLHLSERPDLRIEVSRSKRRGASANDRSGRGLRQGNQ